MTIIDNRPTVFISYSTKDFQFVEMLRAGLKAANIPYWLDREGLQPGTVNWEKAIRLAIKDAASVILVASPNAYETDFVQGELDIAKMYERTIYPVWAHGDHFIACVPMGMGKTQYIDLRANYFMANFPKLIAALGGQNPTAAYIPPTAQPLAPGVTRRSPYKGLSAFQHADTVDFFGRGDAISALIQRMGSIAPADKGRLLAVIGASGSGKSSVVMAGLLPRLKAGALPSSEGWLYVPPLTPGTTPIRALTRALIRALPEKSFGALEDDLRRRDGKGLVNLAYVLDQRMVIYIDQFEELFMPGVAEDEREQVISLLVQAANEPGGTLTVLLTLRADFYDRPTNYRELGALVTTQNYTLLPMSLSELREAIESPAHLPNVGLRFEPGLVGEIVFDLRDSKDKLALAGALPLLQFALEQLYERRDQSDAVHTLTLAAYEAMGGVSGAIRQHADAAFEALDAEAQESLGRVFIRLINVDERGEATRARAAFADFDGDAAALRLIEGLVQARLLLTNREDDHATSLEVAHEALLRTWGRLVVWIESAAEGKRSLQKLETDAKFWAKRGKPRDQYRYIHDQITEIEALRAQWGLKFSPLVEEFLDSELGRLIEDLGSENKARSELAGERLIALGDDTTVPALIQALNDPRANIQIISINLLAKLRDARAVEPLIAALADVDESVRWKVIDVLKALGDERAVKPLIAALADESESVRRRAAGALGAFRDARAVEPLIVALADTNEDVRGWAAMALGAFRDGRAVEPLIVALTDTDANVRGWAAMALGKLRDARAFEPLKALLMDKESSVRKAAAAALAKLEAP